MKLFLPISFLTISIVLFIVVVDPFYNQVSTLRTNIASYNLALNNSTDLQKTQDSLIEKYKSIKQEDKDRLSHFLPNTINNIKFILEIEQIANIHNMQIKNIKFQAEETPATENVNKVGSTSTVSSGGPNLPYGTFPIEFTTDADYNTFVLFLKDLELNLRLVDVQSVGFIVPTPTTKPVAGVDPNIYSYTLKVQTYWLK